MPAVLPPLPRRARRANRLGLARWLVSPENPLTARVTVNRYWQQFFGIGLVKTPEDFGVQGETPSHPELLDWLATEFVAARGWDVKALHRLIVTSATYRQSSRVTAGPARARPAEPPAGARPALPPAVVDDPRPGPGRQRLAGRQRSAARRSSRISPPGVWEEATFGTKRYQQDQGDALYRRSLYTFWRRIVGPTEFFDTAAAADLHRQAGAHQHAAARPDDAQRRDLRRGRPGAGRARAARAPARRRGSASTWPSAWSSPAGRRPRRRQVLLAQPRPRRAASSPPIRAAAQKLLSVGESKRDETLDSVEHAAYTALCSAILNLDEALTKE